ncbi:MAG: GyrI-like domain-containing protein [Eubacteriales bacterium]|nr:GyrI-like domain-containing protein [Eubacteriales bacterium]
MAFDYKKEYKEFYMPPKRPEIIKIPAMNFVAVRGKGDPNEENGEYKQSMSLLYGIAFTIKMSYKGSHKIDGYFAYVVPPLEGLWWQLARKGSAESEGCREYVRGLDYAHKEDFQWISMIRLPDFVTREVFDWAVAEAAAKKKTDYSKVEFLTYDEGECVQCMHVGPYDEEPATIQAMDSFAKEMGYEIDITEKRHHHEIYLSDPRRTAPERCKTVVRHPVRKV